MISRKNKKSPKAIFTVVSLIEIATFLLLGYLSTLEQLLGFRSLMEELAIDLLLVMFFELLVVSRIYGY